MQICLEILKKDSIHKYNKDSYRNIWVFFYAKKSKKLSKNYCILLSYHIKYGQSGTKWRKVEQNPL